MSDVRERTHLALQILRLGATLRSTFISLAPFLTHDNIVFLELLDRFKARCALVLDGLLGTFDSLERMVESELHILKHKKKRMRFVRERPEGSRSFTSALILSNLRSSRCLSKQS